MKTYKGVLHRDDRDHWFELRYNKWEFFCDYLSHRFEVKYLGRRIYVQKMMDGLGLQPRDTKKDVDMFLQRVLKFLESHKSPVVKGPKDNGNL